MNLNNFFKGLLLQTLLVFWVQFSIAQNIPSYIPTNGLVGWWPFNGNANDESGNGNHGTINGAVLSSDRFGVENNAFLFNGTSSFISLGNNITYDGHTFSCWARRDMLNGNVMISKINNGPYGFKNSEFTINAYLIGNGIGWPTLYIEGGYNPQLWNHYAVSFNAVNNEVKYYINGQLMNAAILGDYFDVGNTPIYLGARPYWSGSNGPHFFFGGKLDDIAIWNRALTQAEIIKLYQAGLQYSISTQRDGNCAGGMVNLTATTSVSLSTTAAGSITHNSAISGGNITNDGGQTITQRGVCWSTTPSPTIALSTKTSDGSGSGAFSSSLTGLAASTTYYIRTYATTAAGTWYGDEKSFATSAAVLTITDIDGNVYNTVTIGTQTWMKENLKVSKYRNGDAIPTNLTTGSNGQWGNTMSGAYAIYNNDQTNNGKFGKLYNWYAVVDSRFLCPIGWHIPSDSEWIIMENYLGGASVAGGKLKSSGNLQDGNGQWQFPNTGATNETKFSAEPGGGRYPDGVFDGLNGFGHWWTSTTNGSNNAWYRNLYFGHSISTRGDYNKNYGFSVRCIKD